MCIFPQMEKRREKANCSEIMPLTFNIWNESPASVNSVPLRILFPRAAKRKGAAGKKFFDLSHLSRQKNQEMSERDRGRELQKKAVSWGHVMTMEIIILESQSISMTDSFETRERGKKGILSQNDGWKKKRLPNLHTCGSFLACEIETVGHFFSRGQ